MSDTDTDDTDLLLLIPPNYYIPRQDKMSAAAEADALAMPPPPLPLPPPASTTAAYQFLMPDKKSELNQINARLQNMELERQEEQRRFDAPSDLSTISSSTVRSALGSRPQRELHGMAHSTPKGGNRLEENILQEIDNYLDDNNAWHQNQHQHPHQHQYQQQHPHQQQYQQLQQHYSDDHLRMRGYSTPAHESQPTATSLPSIRLGASPSMPSEKLISLSELWGKSHLAGTVIANNMSGQQGIPALKEEQLRRQHLEKMVQTLQAQMLEYQQRISVAIEVDRSKDCALQQAEQQLKTLNFEVQNMRDSVHKLETERNDAHGKCESLQHELSQAVGLATKFQDKTDKLEAELERAKRQASETAQKLEQVEMQLQSSKRSEELSHAEQNKLRDKFAKADYQVEKLKARIEELEKEKSTLQHQKEMLQEYHQKQKTRADNLELQRKSMQEALANLTDTETNLKKKMEIQQKSLKQYYQQQMENVVAKKLQEFQVQLDKSEENLKAEARERERLIADRAVKQLEMINEKNNQELNLVQEKHNEEVELYRLQLANASKKIDELELQLNCYKTKRADIAQKLHGVMEAQWQQALAILTSPNQTTQLASGETTDSESPDLNNARHYPETPKSSKTQASNNTEKNNLDTAAKKDPPSPVDKLQSYIELLLSKSPSDLDKLDKILSMNTKQNAKPQKRNSNTGSKPPPWKS
ncbi:PREDICTED: centrosome-associated protein CEP250 [Drosophila arizonae]|uniref:Centrosome-associated protein CEP250 n=1 Tax=Drosophila arizonae TaxID=7263 RepID=A0ABM1P5F2_DROAR|nr:PREDICTED: centrosome-associated protein CEP250 [Drosophila arizonae]